ncbi:MAG: heme o synthase, partial [Microthrixaceae bacterium]|nr:heme o synthase [Microthrixaceae bacterium]
KPRIIELLLIETVPVMIVAQRGLPSIWLMVATVVGGTLSAGGANAVNMYIDRDIDAKMERTANRPLVTGAVTPRNALIFALGIEAIAIALLWFAVNPLSALLAFASFAFYVGVYSLWLKRRYSSNIVIGGAAGAGPVLIGWAAVTGSLGWAPWLLFLLIFLWTPPHFWALAVKYREDYASVDVPMLPSVATLNATARKILTYTLALVAVSLVLAPVADLGWVYLASAVVSGGVFLRSALAVLRTPTAATAMRLFGWSITYITVLFGAMAVDQLAGLGWPW